MSEPVGQTQQREELQATPCMDFSYVKQGHVGQQSWSNSEGKGRESSTQTLEDFGLMC